MEYGKHLTDKAPPAEWIAGAGRGVIDWGRGRPGNERELYLILTC
jgi:hypothetical protein